MSTTPHTQPPQTVPSQAQPPKADMFRARVAQMAGPWWMFLVTGIAWLVISFVVLRFTTASAVTVGILMGVVLLVAMANEFLIASVHTSWQWAHALMGVLFLAGGIWCLISPFNAFWALAAVIGVLFILQGALVLITSIESRPVNSVWWLGVVAGGLEILLGFWASQQVVSSRALLLILYVGFLALVRGISEIVLAFELKGAQRAA